MNTFSKRFELKSIVPNNFINSLIEDPNSHFNLLFKEDFYNEQYSFNQISNIYFDNHTCTSFCDSVNNKTIRTKLRLRRYAPDGINENVFYFEIKKKIQGTTLKTRFAVPEKLIPHILESKEKFREFMPQIKNINIDMDEVKFTKVTDEVIQYLFQEGFSPTLRTSYKRISYVHRQRPNMRLTIDKEIEYQLIKSIEVPLPPYKDIDLKENRIVELKVLAADIEFGKILMKEFFNREKSISKYCFGLSQTNGLKGVKTKYHAII